MEFLTAFSDALVLLICVCYLYELIYLFLPLVGKIRHSGRQTPTRYGILIAARNEEAVLPYLLDSIRRQDYPAERITTYVIADNCTDRTAAVAAAAGARVYQRFNTHQVGKGYALNYLLEQLRLSGEWERHDAFLVFDADNLLEPDYITRINQVCSDGYPVFCGYRNSKNFGHSWVSASHAIWYLHESTHLNRSRMLMGSCCTVSGTGFGFTRQLLERMGGWNFFTLTEDIEFRTWCATEGVPIGYCHDAVLYDEQPTTLAMSFRQRTRWVQGGIQVSLRYATAYLKGICRGGRAGWSSYEAASTSLWAFCLSAVSFLLKMLVVFLAGHWLGLLQGVLAALMAAYWSIFFSGLLTLAAEHRRIRATPRELVLGAVSYPLFLFSYLPISVAAVLRKPQWKPIAHTAAIPVSQLQSKD